MALGKRAVQGGFEKGTAQAEEERVRPDRRCKAAYMHICVLLLISLFYLSLLSSIIIIIIIIHEYIYVYMNM